MIVLEIIAAATFFYAVAMVVYFAVNRATTGAWLLYLQGAAFLAFASFLMLEGNPPRDHGTAIQASIVICALIFFGVTCIERGRRRTPWRL